MNFLGLPLGYAILYVYKVVQNYALAIIIFTVILRIVLLPMEIKKLKSIAKNNAYQPYINEINKKYAKNFTKRTEELQKFNQEHDINLAAGCLPTLLPLLVLIGMFDVIYHPLVHILHLSPEIIKNATDIFKASFPNVNSNAIQLNLINDVVADPSKYSALGSDVVESIKSIDLNFLGFNIGKVPNLTSFAVVFPILSLVFSFLQNIVGLKTNSMPTTGGSSALKILMFGMPIVSLFISLNLPIGISIYWIVGYIVQILQTLALSKFCNFNELREKAVEEVEMVRRNKKKKLIESQSGKEDLKGNDRISLARRALSEKYDD